MVPVFRSDDNRPAHLPIKTHATRGTRAVRSPHSPGGGGGGGTNHHGHHPATTHHVRMAACAEEVSKFCEFHSRHAAYHLAHNVHMFLRDHSISPAISQAQFMDKFLEGFRTHFESGFRLAQNGAVDELKCNDDTCCKAETKGSKMKQIKDLFFGKTQWSDVSGQALCGSNIIKVGWVNLLSEKANHDLVWRKIWILLAHTDSGNMLYIYTNKSETPNKAVKCCQLKEARPTRAIESDNYSLSKIAFVIKIQPAEEYILHAQNKHHRNSWVRQIRALIPSDTNDTDDLSDSDGEEDGRSNTGFSSASTGSHSTSTSDSLEPPFDGPTHMDINEFRAVSEVELLSTRRIPKPNSYSSLPHPTPKDSSWQRRFKPFRGQPCEVEGQQSLSLPASRSASRHSRSNSPDCLRKQRSNSLRHDNRNHVIMPSCGSGSLPYGLGSAAMGSDSSLPASGTSSTHSSLGRVYSAPQPAPLEERSPSPSQPPAPAATTTTAPIAEQQAHPQSQVQQPQQLQPQQHQQSQQPQQQSQRAARPEQTEQQRPRYPPPLQTPLALPARATATYSSHTYTNIPPSPSTVCSTPSTITPSVSEEWADTKRHSVPPLKPDFVHGGGKAVASLLSQPWFHSHLSRTEAANHVIMGGKDTHGRFLIRKSDTQKGELVMTFNYEGSARHLRMTLTETGRCKIQHLNFSSVEKMIDHFKKNAIQLDNSTTGTCCREVYLNEFIPSDLQDEGTPVPSHSTTFFPPNVPEKNERPPSISPSMLTPADRPRSRTPPARPPRNDHRVYKGASSRV